jgi:hypothetical protein
MPEGRCTMRFAPRASLPRPPGIRVELTPPEFGLLIQALEVRTLLAADDPEQVDFADFWFRRVAELREASR